MTEMRKWINLIEVKEYFDISKEGAWVNSSGTIEYVEDHGEWVWDKYHSEDYHDAYEDGWIMIFFDPTSTTQGIHMNGYSDNIKDAFKYWWPTALKTGKVWIETEDEENWYEYEIPRDTIKLQKKWRPRWTQAKI